MTQISYFKFGSARLQKWPGQNIWQLQPTQFILWIWSFGENRVFLIYACNIVNQMFLQLFSSPIIFVEYTINDHLLLNCWMDRQVNSNHTFADHSDIVYFMATAWLTLPRVTFIDGTRPKLHVTQNLYYFSTHWSLGHGLVPVIVLLLWFVSRIICTLTYCTLQQLGNN
jgi:hypothetical protein